MNDWKPLHILLRADPIDSIPNDLKKHEHMLFDASDGIDALSEYDDCVHHAYKICAENGANCENIIVVRKMPESLITNFILTEYFDAIFFIDGLESREKLANVFQNLEDFYYIGDRIKSLLFEISRAELGLIQYNDFELSCICKNSYDAISDVGKSFEVLEKTVINRLSPNIIKYFNQAKFSS